MSGLLVLTFIISLWLALFIADLSEVEFTFERLIFILAGQIPILLVITIYVFIYMVLRFSKETLYLLIISTIFGSLAFFGMESFSSGNSIANVGIYNGHSSNFYAWSFFMEESISRWLPDLS